jgi:lysophospholipase L1-like esterase
MVRDALRVVAISLLLFVGLEVGIRAVYWLRNAMVDHVVIPYTAAQDFGPVPPWMDALRILEPDDELSWRNRRGVSRRYLDVYGPVRREEDRTRLLQRFLPGTPAYLRDYPVWTVTLNSRGFRGPEFQTQKPPGVTRVIAVGDSWTFGANVDQADAYPQRLASLLDQALPDREFEVLNLGVMGYSSHQGLALLERTALPLDPDFVLIGFGMNDALVGGWRDKDRTQPERSLTTAAQSTASRLETVKLLRYIAARVDHEPWSIGDYMERVAESIGTPEHAWTGGPASETADYELLEPYTRVSPVDYEQNIRAMVHLVHRSGAAAILLYNSLWKTPYRDALRRVADGEGVALVDSEALIAEARATIEAELESRFELVPRAPAPEDRGGGSSEIETVFRVYAGERVVQGAIHIAGTHPSLGNAVPNTVAARDDGEGGDQRAGDGVWSYTARLPVGEPVFYVYTSGGAPGRWEGMDVPDLRRVVLPPEAEGPVYRPVETFGRLYLQADGWHTNAEGYGLIANAVLAAVVGELTSP